MNKFRNVPAIITLLAGFITSVIMIKYRYTLVNFMWFYICGMLIRFALNKVAEKKENKQKASDEEKEDVSNMEESAQQE